VLEIKRKCFFLPRERQSSHRLNGVSWRGCRWMPNPLPFMRTCVAQVLGAIGIGIWIGAAMWLWLVYGNQIWKRRRGRLVGLAARKEIVRWRRLLPGNPQDFERSLGEKGVGVFGSPAADDPHVRWCGRGGAVRLPPVPIVSRQPPIEQVDYLALVDAADFSAILKLKAPRRVAGPARLGLTPRCGTLFGTALETEASIAG
jgi:hypothetical protein